MRFSDIFRTNYTPISDSDSHTTALDALLVINELSR